MPVLLLHLGTIENMVQNQVYALPARQVIISGTGTFEVSQDGSTWVALIMTSGQAGPIVIPFIRATAAGSILVAKAD